MKGLLMDHWIDTLKEGLKSRSGEN
jgi:hypothetical protein